MQEVIVVGCDCLAGGIAGAGVGGPDGPGRSAGQREFTNFRIGGFDLEWANDRQEMPYRGAGKRCSSHPGTPI
jgi:hypothetical protein